MVTALLSALLIIGRFTVNPVGVVGCGVMVTGGVLLAIDDGSTVAVIGALEMAGKKIDERAGSQLTSSQSTMMYKIYTRYGHKLCFFVG